jgi:hypothetical protein
MTAVWSHRFEDPIPLSGGHQLFMLKDAADYLMALPKVEQNLPDTEFLCGTRSVQQLASKARQLGLPDKGLKK